MASSTASRTTSLNLGFQASRHHGVPTVPTACRKDSDRRTRNVSHTHPQGKRRGLTPCAVIVDTRNVNGMLNDLFGGSGHRVSGEGIRKAMRFYNPNVREIHAGIATEPRGSATSERMQSMLRTNRAYRDARTRWN